MRTVKTVYSKILCQVKLMILETLHWTVIVIINPTNLQHVSILSVTLH